VPAQDTPGPRFGHELVFDEAREMTLLFGGFGPDGVPKRDTWGWDGESWHLLATTGPSPRKWPGAAYDSRRGVVVLFGGREGVGRSGPSLADTWIWNGHEWKQSKTVGPSGRDHHRMVFDRRRDRMILFGGWNGTKVVGDTWEWDGLQWRQASSSGPKPRAPFGMAYHDGLSQVVLMGGQDLDQTFSDVWTWNGSDWINLEVDGPGPRGFHAMTYDSGSHRVLLYGGRHGDHLLRDLWSWDGQKWARLSNAGPLRRGIYASAYDSIRGTFVIHSGGDLNEDGWQLEATTWTWSESSGWVEISGGNGF